MTRRLALVVCAYLATLALCVPAAGQNGALRVGGAVPRPFTITPADIAAMPHRTVTVAGRDQSETYDGVLLVDLLRRAGAPSGDALRGAELAKYVLVTGADGYQLVLALSDLDAGFGGRMVLLADRRNGVPLPENARPYQLIIPGDQRPARWVRQVVSISINEAPRTPASPD